ncbi:hypothetical protein RclHR1_11170006 [Rhizophagus clarus]|uniref:Uncharacterized protein n=1 Tax=Rhizophagus clarus TaxID=94130 RepID=A0A2Z6QWI7_9GLOM|nr:hypothetical protein RclHR1_11170004 [Rhizophagus clarus]GBB84598.1 hypothetical protein RclHR1_11170006 [Rhizophagus clarus]
MGEITSLWSMPSRAIKASVKPGIIPTLSKAFAMSCDTIQSVLFSLRASSRIPFIIASGVDVDSSGNPEHLMSNIGLILAKL